MRQKILGLWAAVLVLFCLPVAAEGAETIPEQATPYEGTVVDMFVWREEEGWIALQAGESFRLTNGQGQVLTYTA